MRNFRAKSRLQIFTTNHFNLGEEQHEIDLENGAKSRWDGADGRIDDTPSRRFTDHARPRHIGVNCKLRCHVFYISVSDYPSFWL